MDCSVFALLYEFSIVLLHRYYEFAVVLSSLKSTLIKFCLWPYISQDYRIAERIEKEGKGCLIVVNKWDTIPNKNQHTATYYEQDVREKLRLLNWAPIVYSTAVAGNSVEKYGLVPTGCHDVV